MTKSNDLNLRGISEFEESPLANALSSHIKQWRPELLPEFKDTCCICGKEHEGRCTMAHY